MIIIVAYFKISNEESANFNEINILFNINSFGG